MGDQPSYTLCRGTCFTKARMWGASWLGQAPAGEPPGLQRFLTNRKSVSLAKGAAIMLLQCLSSGPFVRCSGHGIHDGRPSTSLPNFVFSSHSRCAGVQGSSLHHQQGATQLIRAQRLGQVSEEIEGAMGRRQEAKTSRMGSYGYWCL